MNIELLCLDFDGTIMVYDDDEPYFHPDIIRALNHLSDRGAAWITNSGRGFRDQQNILKRSRARGLRHDPAALICRECLMYQRVDHHYESMEPWNTRAVENMVRTHGRLQTRKWEAFREIVKTYEPNEMHLHHDATVFLVSGRDDATRKLVEDLERLVGDDPDSMVLRNGDWIAILPRSLGKGNTLRAFLDMKDMSRDTVLAVGDHGNDISMLDGSAVRHVGCPGDAHPEVIEIVRTAGGYVAAAGGPMGTLDVMAHFGLA